jgi:hypothetical protein
VPGAHDSQWRLASSCSMDRILLRPGVPHKQGISGGEVTGAAGTLAP